MFIFKGFEADMEPTTVADTSRSSSNSTEVDLTLLGARRTAFVARFIVLREARRTRAHRKIEKLGWGAHTTAEELAEAFRKEFIENGDNMVPVNRDIRRALAHADRSLNHFIGEYSSRATLNFVDALSDYERSNTLLFGDDEHPKSGGWRLIQELKRERDLGK